MAALRSALPPPAEYLAEYEAKVAPHQEEVYQYLQLDEAGPFDAIYNRRDL